MKSFQIKLRIFVFFVQGICLSQEVFQGSREYDLFKFNYEHNFSFSKFSIIGDQRWKDSFDNLDSSFTGLIFDKEQELKLGLRSFNDDFSIYCSSTFFFNDNIYTYLNARIVSDLNMYSDFSGNQKVRFGFQGGEINSSGIGYQKKGLMLQYGRGKQNWGAGNDIELALSSNSVAFDHFVLELTKRKLKYRYFHGFLESLDNYNRYITGKGLEYSNFDNVRLAMSEIIIYSGINRPFDFIYLNPVSSHLEIEINNRSNTPSSNLANAVWSFCLDIKLRNNFRIFSNFLIDELTIDKIERDENKAHGLAHSSKIIYSLDYSSPAYFSISYVTVGTKTFRHRSGNGNGINNFVYSNQPIGWSMGSDTQELSLEYNQIFKNKFFNKLKLSLFEIGEESILENSYNPYENYLRTSYPSGNTKKIEEINYDLKYFIKKNLTIALSTTFSRIENNKFSNFKFILDYFFHMKN